MFQYPKDLVLTDIDGNGLVMDKAEDGGDSIDQSVQLQPQIEEDTPEQETLDSTAKTMKAGAITISII